MIDNYEINSETLVIVPYESDKSKVYEYDDEFIVKMSPLSIIKNSCLFFGSTFDGRKAASKSMLGIDRKVPVIIEDSRNIIFFPVSSCINRSSIWISYQNLLKYSKLSVLTSNLYFKNNMNLKLDVKYNLIDNQIMRCVKMDILLEKRKKFCNNISETCDE